MDEKLLHEIFRKFDNIITIDWQQSFSKIEIGTGVCLQKGKKIAILSIGTIVKNVTQAISEIENSVEIAHYDLRFVKPLDKQLLHEVFKKFDNIITVEDGTIKGGFGSAILEFASENNYQNQIKVLGVPDNFIHHGTTEELYQICGIDVGNIKQIINEFKEWLNFVNTSRTIL